MVRFASTPPPVGKEKILDAAELLFARSGYHGASLREITRAAGVELGLSSYHFRSKDELYRQVLLRRASDMASDLDHALSTIPDDLERDETIRAIVAAYVNVHMEKLHSEDLGWQSYVRLAAQAALLLQSANVTNAAAVIYDPIIARYKAALSRHLPEVSPAMLDRHFYVFSMALLGIVLDMTDARLRLVESERSEEKLAITIVDIFATAFLGSNYRVLAG